MRIPIVAAFVLLAVPAHSLTPAELDARIDEIVSAALAESGAPSVSVAISQNKKIVYAHAFGKAAIAENRPATADTRYAVGSISKEFTAAALLYEQEQGKLSLDDKVGQYFPELTRAGEVTLRQLLAHTAGYEDYAPQDYIIPEWTKPTTPQAILDHWAKKPLNFDPGTRWQYSNTNFVLAGEIFEKVSGEKLVDFLKAHIFQPLGMATASDCDAKNAADAAAYTRFALGPPRPVAREAEGWYFAAGELCMTASDLARWDIAFLEKKFLSAASYQQFTQEAKLSDGKPTRYALGLQLGETDGVPMIYHGGEVSGFLALNRMYPVKEISVTLLSNEDGINLIGPLANQIAHVLLSDPSSDTKSKEASPEEIAEVRGILDGLTKGKIDRGLLTSNANSYFNGVALRDIGDSLRKLGALQSVKRVSETLRGGMIHRTYRAEYGKKTLALNVYVMPDGKYEQFLVEEQL